MGAVTAIERAVPGVGMLRTYRPAWLGKDVTAGLVLTAERHRCGSSALGRVRVGFAGRGDRGPGRHADRRGTDGAGAEQPSSRHT